MDISALGLFVESTKARGSEARYYSKPIARCDEKDLMILVGSFCLVPRRGAATNMRHAGNRAMSMALNLRMKG